MNTIGVQSIDEIAKKILILWLSETSGSERWLVDEVCAQKGLDRC